MDVALCPESRLLDSYSERFKLIESLMKRDQRLTTVLDALRSL